MPTKEKLPALILANKGRYEQLPAFIPPNMGRYAQVYCFYTLVPAKFGAYCNKQPNIKKWENRLI